MFASSAAVASETGILGSPSESVINASSKRVSSRFLVRALSRRRYSTEKAPATSAAKTAIPDNCNNSTTLDPHASYILGGALMASEARSSQDLPSTHYGE